MAAFLSDNSKDPLLRNIPLPFTNDLVYKIGRAEDNDIKLQNSHHISRYHAQLVYQNDDWYIMDCKSSNGVFINDIKIEPHRKVVLKDGDSVIFDYQPNKTPRYSFKYKNEREDDPPNQSLFKKPRLTRLIQSDENVTKEAELKKEEELKIDEIEKLRKKLEEKEKLLKEKEEENIRKAQEQIRERELQFEEEKKKLLEHMQMEKQKTGQVVAEVQREYEEKIKKQEQIFTNEMQEIENKKIKSEQELQKTITETTEKFQNEKEFMKKTLEEQIENTSKMFEREKEELKAEQNRMKQELEDVTKRMTAQASTSDSKDKMINLMEEELICSICSELFICPMSLQCTHTFCALCIHQWIKRKNECPQCRNPITSKANSLAMQNYIDKAVTLLSLEMRERRRRLLIERREETEKFNRQNSGRGRTRASSRNTVVYIAPRHNAIQEVIEIRPRPSRTQFIDLTQTPTPRFALRRGRPRDGRN